MEMTPDTSGVEIRAAFRADLEAICDLWEQLSLLHARLDPIFTPGIEGRRHYRRWVLNHINDEQSMVLVACRDGEVVAYGLARISALPPILQVQRIGTISDVAVDEGFRNRGIGRLLVQDLEQRMLKMGVRRMEVKTSSRNPAANHFWESVCGFTEFMKSRHKILKR